jgi:hypothetical protein
MQYLAIFGYFAVLLAIGALLAGVGVTLASRSESGQAK